MTAHIFVNGERLSGHTGGEAFEFKLHVFVGEQVRRQKTLTNRFQLRVSVFASQIENAQAGAIGLLRIGAGFQ